MRKYNKMVLDEVDFTDQEKMVDYLNIYTLSVRKTFASAMSKYLQYLHQPNDKNCGCYERDQRSIEGWIYQPRV